MINNLTLTDYYFLSLFIDLVEEALKAGDRPFGSILIDKDGNILAQSATNSTHELNLKAQIHFHQKLTRSHIMDSI